MTRRSRLIVFSTAIAASGLFPLTVGAVCNIYNGKAYGDCSGVNINTKPTPYKTIKGHETLSGISKGATVESGGSLNASGIIDRIVVRPGARAEIGGIVDHVRNEGGTIEIHGQVGRLEAQAGTTTIVGMVDSVSGSGKVVRRTGSVVGGTPTP